MAIPLYIILYLNLSFPPLQNFLAYLIFQTFKFLGYTTSLNGYFLTIQNFPEVIEISWDSTGWKSLYALAALVIATPSSKISKKIKFLLLALPILFLINYFRIFTTILFSLKFGSEYFEVIHLFLWREGLIFAVIAIWAFYFFRVR